jgi:hypothetical protein
VTPSAGTDAQPEQRTLAGSRTGSVTDLELCQAAPGEADAVATLAQADHHGIGGRGGQLALHPPCSRARWFDTDGGAGADPFAFIQPRIARS